MYVLATLKDKIKVSCHLPPLPAAPLLVCFCRSPLTIVSSDADACPLPDQRSCRPTSKTTCPSPSLTRSTRGTATRCVLSSPRPMQDSAGRLGPSRPTASSAVSRDCTAKSLSIAAWAGHRWCRSLRLCAPGEQIPSLFIFSPLPCSPPQIHAVFLRCPPPPIPA